MDVRNARTLKFERKHCNNRCETDGLRRYVRNRWDADARRGDTIEFSSKELR